MVEADSTRREPLFRVSLRELLVLCALSAVAIVSLLYANERWQGAIVMGTVIVTLVAGIVAVVDRGARQAFAIGFAMSVVLYGVVLANTPRANDGPSLELNPYTGTLPTSRLLLPLFENVAVTRWIDFRTGQEILDYDPQAAGQSNQFASLDQRPEQAVFMRIGHCWWALLLGYLGGWFARFVYLRRLGGGPVR